MMDAATQTTIHDEVLNLNGDDLKDVRDVTSLALYNAADSLKEGNLAALGEIGGYLAVLEMVSTAFDPSFWVYEEGVPLTRDDLDCLVRFAVAERSDLVEWLEKDPGYGGSRRERSRAIGRERLALIDRFLARVGEVDR